MISFEGDEQHCVRWPNPAGELGRMGHESYLERLRIPVLDLLDGRHLAETIRQLAKILDTMC